MYWFPNEGLLSRLLRDRLFLAMTVGFVIANAVKQSVEVISALMSNNVFVS
jgi:hypothetical protein